jgi:hypothetical protein
MSFWHYMFGWYTGGVWSNIIASFIWAFPAWGFVLWRQAKHHKHVRDSLAELHRKHDDMLMTIRKDH